jgi:hypothetical protein
MNSRPSYDIPDHHPACVHNEENDNYECEVVGDPARWVVCGECTCEDIIRDLKDEARSGGL